MYKPVRYRQKTLHNIQMGLAASLVMLTQGVMAADEIGITPYQRQLTFKNDGIITLKFELENRSGTSQQLQELITLPAGWQLISNTAPFLLANGARDIRLIHISPPKGANAGNYAIAYQVAALNNGGVTSNQIININLQTQAGLKLETQQTPNNLLAGEAFSVDFSLENIGNTKITYKLDAYDTDGFIQAIKPKQVTLEAGQSTLIRVHGQVRTKTSETARYSLTLQARGGGRKAEQTANMMLIAQTPQGIGKYQKLPGKLKASYTIEPGTDNKNANWLAQLEYYGRGNIDHQGKHNIEIKLRNGEKQGDNQVTDQLEEYYLAYWNDELKVKTGHQAFTTNELSGNSLSGIGASASYMPKNKQGKHPLKLQAFYGKTQNNKKTTEQSIYAALNYKWEQYELSSAILEYQKGQEKKQTIHSIRGSWYGKNITTHTEIASDSQHQVYSHDLTAQWNQLGFNTTVARADKNFAGSISDALQLYGNLSYQLDERNTFSIRLRHNRNNLERDNSYEIRQVQEGQLRFTHTLATENPAEITTGYRYTQEQDLRTNTALKQATQAGIIEYKQQFEAIDLRLAVEAGKRTDQLKIKTSTGLAQEFSINWHPQANLNLGVNTTINQELDHIGKTYSAGINGQYNITPRSQISGYIQRAEKQEDNSYSESYSLEYKHDLRKLGQLTLSAQQNKNISVKQKDNEQDCVLKLEYSLPLDLPFNKRENIGSLEGKLYQANGEAASDVILQMDNNYAVTNKKGEFSYPDIVAKDYQLTIDSSHTNAKGLILDTATENNLIQIQANKTTRVNLLAHQGAHLKGRLLRFIPDTSTSLATDEPTTLKADKGIGMVLLELHPLGDDHRTIHRRSTLYDGSFSFLGIPPGQWELIVVNTTRIPEHFNLEKTRFVIDLKPGTSNTELLIKALPTAQTIKKVGPQQGFDVSG